MSTNIEKRDEEKRALMQSVLDQKLSRAELLDLIMSRIDEDLLAQIAALDAEDSELDQFELKDFLPLLRTQGKLKVKHHWRNDNQIPIVVEAQLNLKTLPLKVQKKLARLNEIGRQRSELSTKRYTLKSGKHNGRLAMIRESLNSTSQGRAILEAIEALKDHVRDRYLTPKLPAKVP